MNRPLAPDDYPYFIDNHSIRGVYGDGNPWVRWAMEYDPQAVKYPARTALAERATPVKAPKRGKL